jgi:hypothetical protein
MGWDGVDMAGEQGRRRPAADILAAEFSGQDQTVVALDASVANGRAYLAARGPARQVQPVYPLDPIDETDPEHPFPSYQDFPVQESPQWWPARITEALTTRERSHVRPRAGAAAEVTPWRGREDSWI